MSLFEVFGLRSERLFLCISATEDKQFEDSPARALPQTESDKQLNAVSVHESLDDCLRHATECSQVDERPILFQSNTPMSPLFLV